MTGAFNAQNNHENGPSADVEPGKRLVLALTEDLGIDQLHACGGKARCTTCRVEILEAILPRCDLLKKPRWPRAS